MKNNSVQFNSNLFQDFQSSQVGRKEQQMYQQQGQKINSIEDIHLELKNQGQSNSSRATQINSGTRYHTDGNPNNYTPINQIGQQAKRNSQNESSSVNYSIEKNQNQQQNNDIQRNQIRLLQNQSLITQPQNQEQYKKNQVYSDTVIAITNTTNYAQNLVARYLEDNNITNYELLTVPGGIFGLQNNEFWENYVLKSIEILNLKETPKAIYLFSVLGDYFYSKMYGQSDDKNDQRREAYCILMKLQMKLIATPQFHGYLLSGSHETPERLF
ncbi:unnamed protein product [Paramecium octaurelia]|uniref:Uncharacterized protein n=1 Tax=Paramecium octaurelia TaxID=43137 RepID=A0A8S1WR44_PAROT|nr:unnamed protein product [Paramecium octaurelia]